MKTKVYALIHIPLSIIMPMSMIRCGNHGRKQNLCVTIPVIRTQNQKVVQWWVSMVVKLLLIIWPDREHHCRDSHLSSDNLQICNKVMFNFIYTNNTHNQSTINFTTSTHPFTTHTHPHIHTVTTYKSSYKATETTII